jgi:hypothetical protein
MQEYDAEELAVVTQLYVCEHIVWQRRSAKQWKVRKQRKAQGYR